MTTDDGELTRPETREDRIRRLLAERVRRSAPVRGGRAPTGELSYPQERMWFLHLMDPGSPAYNITSVVRLRGPVDPDRLRRAVRGLLARHPLLRSRFVTRPDGTARRETLPSAQLPSPLQVVRTEVDRSVQEALHRPFDLTTAPLLRVVLAGESTDRYLMALVVHHIVADGWTLGILHRELRDRYADDEEPPADADTSAVDVAVAAEREWVATDQGRAGVAYWRRQLRDLPPIELPMTGPRPPVARFVGIRREALLSAELSTAFEELARRHGCSLYMAVVAAFAALLHRYSGQTDLVLGSPVANRTSTRISDMVGLFVNTVVIRVDASGDPTFADILGRTRSTVLDALRHQRVPFEVVVDELRPERTLSQNPLFQVLVAHQNADTGTLELPGTVADRVGADLDVARFDVELTTWRLAEGIRVRVNLAADLFDEAVADRILGEFERLVRSVVQAPDVPVRRLVVFAGGDRGGHAGHRAAPPRTEADDLWQWFDQVARRRPDAPAVTDASRTASFTALRREALAVCDHLRSLGVEPGDRVAVAMDRTVSLVAATLGVVAAGAAFVPVNPGDPPDRTGFIVADSGARGTLVDGTAGRWLGVEAPERVPGARPDGVAYVIYTSGTTGRPKGVAVEHGNLLNTLAGCQQEFDIDQSDVGLVLAASTFDVFYYELFSVLLAGGHSRVVNRAELFAPESIVPLLGEASRVQAVPGLMEHLLASLEQSGVDVLPAMRQVITGGDAVPAPLLERLMTVCPNAAVTVTYGPTEAAIFATHYRAERGVEGYPIGRPLPGVQIVVADDNGTGLPNGVTGEIWIGGRGVARGYVNRAEDTAARFVERDGTRFYRSGDRGRWDVAADRLEFRGRADTQVKVRGFRIELGEVESVLTGLERVRHGVVVKVGGGPSDSRLVGYAVVEPGPTGPEGRGDEQVRDWQLLFDQTHRRRSGARRDLTGWNSSYDGEPMPAAEMDEWVDRTVARVRRVLAGTRAGTSPRVLEIGCGTGLLAAELAADCAEYVGTDFSAQALDIAAGNAAARGLTTLRLLHRDARLLADLPAHFDLVVLNSVAQYFPSLRYLDEVLDGARRLLRPGGAIFCGDIRSLPLLPAFHASVLRHGDHGDGPPTTADLRARLAAENELVIDPRYFAQQAGTVRAEPKDGRSVNELTKFRYDVTVWPDRTGQMDVPWHEWSALAGDRSVGPGVDLLADVLAGLPPALGLRAVPDARLVDDVAYLHQIDPSGARPGRGPAVRQDELHDLAAAHGYQVRTSVLSARADGTFDAVLFRADGPAAFRWPTGPDARPDGRPKNPVELSTRPVNVRWASAEGARLRADLAARLPGYMVPDTVVVLDELPFTPNGKVDRSRLPAVPRSAGDGRAPSPGTEQTVADVFGEVVGAGTVSATDDLFRIGGTSLTAIRATVALRGRGLVVPPQRLFEHSTVERLAAWIDSQAPPVESHQSTAGTATLTARPTAPPAARASATRAGPPTGREEGPARPAGTADDEWHGYTQVLLTGATGFLGVHLLDHALRAYPDLALRCLVRAADPTAAQERLWRVFHWHFPSALDRVGFDERVRAIPGDLSVDRLALSERNHRLLARETGAVLHAAADVRHVADRDSVYRVNVDGTRSVTRFCERAGARLAHISTIGVAGRCRPDQELSLSESDLDVGQTPTEDYSASKLAAERTVRASAVFGDAVSVLRVGTVAPHSVTGRFQRNIDSHFFSRYLRASLALGVAPDWPGREFRPIPADAMAEAVFALTGPASARGGTFHLQPPDTLSHAELAGYAAELGYPVTVLEVDEFIARVGAWSADADRADDVGRLLPWLSRPRDRAVRLDTARTDRRLAELGFHYPRPDRNWVRRFIRHGVEVGYLPAPPGHGEGGRR